MKNVIRCSGGWAVLACVSFSQAQVGPGQLKALERRPDVVTAVGEELDTGAFTLVDLSLPREPGAPFDVAIPIEGEARVLTLEPRSVRGPGFRAIADTPQGQREIVPPPSATYRGTLSDAGSSRAAASLIAGQLHAMIRVGDKGDTVWNVTPLSRVIPTAPASVHVLYRESDATPRDWTCAVPNVRPAVPMPSIGTREIEVCELALDADFQFYQANGSNEATTITDMENVINGISVIYENECEVTFEVVFTIVRTSSGTNPYTTNDPSGLLDQFRAYWISNHASVQRDLAHLFTGRDLTGSVIGIAFQPGVCSGVAYGLSQSRYTGNQSFRNGLTAHEVGHNFNAPHCDGQNPCYIMCSGLGGCNGSVTQFGVNSSTVILNYSKAVGCLSPAEPPPVALPFFEDFEAATINEDKWTSNSGGEISTAGTNPPSPTRSLNLDLADTITSVRMDVPTSGGLYEIRYHTQRKSVEVFEALQVEYFSTSLGIWKDLNVILSDGATQTTFDAWVHPLPADARGSEFRLRFHAVGFQSDDDWYIDNVEVLEVPPPPVALPFFDDFTGVEIDPAKWTTISGVELSTAATNPPSATQTLNLDLNDSITTNRVDVPSSGGDPLLISFHTQRKNVPVFRALSVEYFSTSLAQWKELTTLISDGVTQTNFDYHEFDMPADGYGPEFRLRFTSIGFLATEDWYVDDVRVGASPLPPPLALPFFDDFPDATIDGTKWTVINGAATSTAATNPPSSPRTLNLDSADDITSARIDASAATGKWFVSYSTQHKGVENGKTLDVEYYSTSAGMFKPLQTIASDGVDQSFFLYHEFELPADGFGDELQLRFGANGTAANDDWYIDDVRVDDFCRTDIEQDGDLDIFDFLAFQSALAAQAYVADWEHDGDWDVFDFLGFQGSYAAGCY